MLIGFTFGHNKHHIVADAYIFAHGLKSDEVATDAEPLIETEHCLDVEHVRSYVFFIQPCHFREFAQVEDHIKLLGAVK